MDSTIVYRATIVYELKGMDRKYRSFVINY